MIQEIQTLETATLVDMLATYTTNYSRMLKEGSSDKEFAKCGLTIRSIQAEIDSRKKKAANTSTTGSNTNFQSEYTK